MTDLLAKSDVSVDATSLKHLRLKLLEHSLYGSVESIHALRLFMREHVFAVWDFMSLLKRLQQIVTCCEVPWLPAADASLARFINEIVIAEESDEDGLGGYASHFELYLAAMDEIGADARPIRKFVASLRDRVPFDQAISEASILPSTRQFVKSTLQLTTSGQPHEVASAFFHGREDVIPDMFSRLVKSLPREGVPVKRLVHYLQRHIELDASDHGPLAHKLVNSLCKNSSQREDEATSAAINAISERIALWDGVLAELGRTAW